MDGPAFRRRKGANLTRSNPQTSRTGWKERVQGNLFSARFWVLRRRSPAKGIRLVTQNGPMIACVLMDHTPVVPWAPGRISLKIGACFTVKMM